MKKTLKVFFYCLPFLCLFSCVEPYVPPAIQAPNSYLVVEGFINAGGGGTRIKLSRTRNLADSLENFPELYADVRLETEGTYIPLIDEDNDGEYRSLMTDFVKGSEFNLQIITADGKEYRSDPIPVKESPPIDSIHWQRTPEGVEIMVDTHDPSGESRYYMWEYQENWEFRAAYSSLIEYKDGEFVVREQEDARYKCWQEEKSSSLKLASSAKLEEDIISKQSLVFIPEDSWKLSEKYSILVRQWTLSAEAFHYFQQMKKNSEQQGTIFDPQPSEVRGNISCLSNPNEPVVGFISASSADEKRIFIDKYQIDGWNYRQDCEMLEFGPGEGTSYFASGFYNILYVDFSTGIVYAATPLCSDCTKRGTQEKPHFWE